MKKNILFYIFLSSAWCGFLILSVSVTFAQSTTLATDGIYVPRMTSAQRDSINSPVNGQMIYNINHECFNVYQKDSWQKLCGFDIKNTNSWVQKADVGGSARSLAIGFSIGDKGYIGTGFGTSPTYLKDFWEYNPTTDSWTQKADFGGTGRYRAVGFSIGTKGYIGTGVGSINILKDFWEYDPQINQWIEKAQFGGTARSGAIGFSINNKGYIGAGFGDKKDFWEYNPTTDSWSQKANFPRNTIINAVGFSIGAKGYIGTGSYQKDIWEYNPITDRWVQKAGFGGVADNGAVGFSIGNKGYIWTGSYQKDIWEYNPMSTLNGMGTDNQPKGSWVQKKDVGISGVSFAIGFSIGNKGYIGTGMLENDKNIKTFWEYSPDETNITQQGNTFNGNTQLVKTDGTGKIPITVLPTTATMQGNNFNLANQLVKTDTSGKIPTTVLPANATTQGNNFNLANQLTKLDSSGFLGIGVASPKALIHLPNSVTNRKIILWQNNMTSDHQFFGFGINPMELRYQVDMSHSSHVFYVGNDASTSTELFRIKGTGGACLNGNMVTTGASCTSDIRYKRNLSSIENPLDKVLQMNGFYYFWKTEQFKEKNFPTSRQIGFIAQEVEALFPELVDTDEKGYKSVDYARLTPVLVEAIKELKKEVTTMHQENTSIRKDIEVLKNLILQAQIDK